eukprot:Em0016g225a
MPAAVNSRYGGVRTVLQVVPLSKLVIQGNHTNTPASFAALSCVVHPPQFTATWFYAGTALSSMGKYLVSQNALAFNDTTTYGSVLIIQLLSYSDAGNYTLKLEVLGPTNITVNATTASQVELSCEMSQYIHPDGDLWWYRGRKRLDITKSKYSIEYRHGTKLAQNGGNDVTTSRVFVLTISRLTSSDSGVYTCRLFGTDQSGDVNLMVVGGEQVNITNATGRDAATTEGIILTYASLFFMALGPIVLGSVRSVNHQLQLQKKGEEASDRILMKDAAVFPLYASGGLFGLYLFFKYIPKEYVNLILSVIFIGLGISALARAICVLVDPLLPEALTSWFTKYHVKLTVTPPKKKPEESETTFNTGDLIVWVKCAALGVVYFFSKNWILNNLFGLAFCLNAIELISLDSFGVGCLLLGGLFVYDIFWVFGTDVMVTVAKSFEAPIKCLFIALLCRFDYKSVGFMAGRGHHPNRSRAYFFISFFAYIVGLLLTIGVMHVFKAAQPALLYLVPCCVGAPLLLALCRGDIMDLFRYRDYPEKPTPSSQSEEPEPAHAKED